MHASKAIGVFLPQYKAIGVSDVSIEGRGFTFAHEYSHFIDAYIGEKQDQHFGSDKDGSIANTVAKNFRNEMQLAVTVKKGMISYYNRTCECFARAMEQYYAIKKGESGILQSEYNKDGSYPTDGVFIEKIMPLCEQFFKENEQMLKSLEIFNA